MNCQLVQENLPLLINKRLPQRENYQVFLHLGQCKNCRTKLIEDLKIQEGLEIAPGKMGKIPDIDLPGSREVNFWQKQREGLVDSLMVQILAFSKLK